MHDQAAAWAGYVSADGRLTCVMAAARALTRRLVGRAVRVALGRARRAADQAAQVGALLVARTLQVPEQATSSRKAGNAERDAR
jgi:hypothetical protein